MPQATILSDDESIRIQERSRIPTIHMQGWDEANPGTYYVTICTKDRTRWLGHVRDDRVHLSPIGRIVEHCWQSIPHHFPQVTLDAFILMPNHLHGILTIGERKPWQQDAMKEAAMEMIEAVQPPVTTQREERRLSPLFGSLDVIFRQFTSACTKRIWERGHIDFAWQPRFYERLLRTDEETTKTRRHIRINPYLWGVDELNI